MSISHALSNALSGLSAASRGAAVVSSNLANSLTEGYGRRELALSAEQVANRGAGVRIDGIVRIVDRAVIAERRAGDADLAHDETLARAHVRLERLVGPAGSDMGLEARMRAFEQALVTASSDPASGQRLETVVEQMRDLAGALNQASGGVQQMRVETEAEIAQQVETLNRSLRQVDELNTGIFRLRNGGQDTSALMDQRQRVIDTIASIVPVKELQRQGDQVALMTSSGQMLLDGSPVEVGFTPRNTITADMTVASGGLGGLSINGEPVAGPGAAGRLGGGSLGAAFALRDEVFVEAQARLDGIAADLALRFQDPAVDPTLTAGMAGLFTDGGAAVDPLDTVGLSGRLAVNAAVDPDQGGAVWRLRDGVAATVPGPVGRATQIDAWSDALMAARPDAGGAMRSAAGHVGALTARFGSERVAAEDEVAFSTARWETIRQAELADGVDTDYEMQRLLQIEEAYSANAKVIETIGRLMDRLMEI